MAARDTTAVVIGGGLGGLMAAAHVARDGRRVVVVEGRARLGGRARGTRHRGFHLDLGPHALYRAGATQRALDRLGIDVGGGAVPPAALAFVVDGELRRGPLDARGLLGRSVLPPRDRAEILRLLRVLRRRHDPVLAHTPIAEVLDDRVTRPAARGFLEAVLRLTTYAADPDRQAADAALSQLVLGLRSVRYLDGGWTRLVGAVERAAVAAGAQVLTADPAVAVEHDDRVRGVVLRSGRRIPADAVVVASGGPHDVARLVDLPERTAAWTAAAVPVRAACLTVALERLPRPRRTYAIDLELPRYLSVHSAFADQAPPGGAVVQVARYLGGEPADPARHREELVEHLSIAQPGWEDAAADVRFLPEMTVSHDLPTAEAGGLRGRPGPLVPEVDGLAVVGDWVGAEGLLADATTASALEAARTLVPAGRRSRVGAR